jgi:hypothetical protein
VQVNDHPSLSSQVLGRKPIRPARLRYIKLGQAGKWERESIDKGIIRFGFGTAAPDRYAICRAGRWDELARSFEAQGEPKGNATRFTNETRAFFEADESTLWLTFVGERMYWGFLDESPAEPHADMKGTWRPVRGGWNSTDIAGSPLTRDRLSGSVTKLTAYRGTSCRVEPSVADYVVRRINGQRTPEVERALAAAEGLREAVVALMRLLGPRDFELLVDLVFSASGWRRLGIVGKTQKTLDLDLLLPSTGERAFVQVKSATSQGELDDYVQRLADAGPYDRMFFVYHSGNASTSDERVIVIGPNKLAEMVLDAGLVDWLVRKTS